MYLVSRTETFAKLFFIVSFTGLFMYVALAFYSFHTAYTTVTQIEKLEASLEDLHTMEVVSDRFEKDLKYILVWTVEGRNSKDFLGFEGQTPFIENNCKEINCYVTTNKTILNNDYTNFDAVVFNMSLIWLWRNSMLPRQRKPRQKYVFYGMEACDERPICNIRLDNFFNWTWTYKFYSDVFSPFIEVRDLDGHLIAPSRNVIWTEEPQPITKSDIKTISAKKKALAWIVDKCDVKANSMLSIKKLKRALKEFSLDFDIYGCGNLRCPKEGCLEAIRNDYYFYLVYDGSVAEDYVTSEVLKAYNNNAVPIMVGGADYVKFLPENSYISFQYFTEEKLAALLAHTIKNPVVYREYFYWKKFYTIKKADEFKGYCDLCKLLNDKEKFNNFSTYKNFRTWWYVGSLKEKCMPKGAERYSEILSYFNDSTGRQF